MTPDERGAVFMLTVQRIIDESEEIKEAALDLARSYGTDGIQISFTVTASVDRAYACAAQHQAAELTVRDKQFLKAMRITQE